MKKDKLKLTTRVIHPQDTVVRVKGAAFGSDEIVVVAGPCSVEEASQMSATANAVAGSGAKGLRGGAFKPRTSPYSFQGLGEDGLKIMREAADANSMFVVTEVLDVREIDVVSRYADIVQVGARNMQNYALLRELGRCETPVVLKRGWGATIEEWLCAAEYILLGGNSEVILCERGVRGFDPSRPIIPDISAIPLAKRLSHLPVIFDPSHSTGRSVDVAAASYAAVAAGADGILVEVHSNPSEASSDKLQTISTEEFSRIMERLQTLAGVVGRQL